MPVATGLSARKMKKFLEEVATALWSEYGSRISEQRIVFTGKRARLFFNEALLKASEGEPIWQPHYMTIDEVVHNLSGLQKAEHLRLVAELYKIYNRYHPESFDRFYRWGEMLLSDFDTIDKYMIDARAIYANISDLREVDAQFSELFSSDDPSLELVRGFWQTMNARHAKSTEQQHFIHIWQSLFEIYTLYRQRLRELGIGYAGMIYRDVAESLSDEEYFNGQSYCFVGFNALNECEKRLFDHLVENGRASLFWDYDNYFLTDPNQEAGRFIRRNIECFSDNQSRQFDHDNFLKNKSIEVISTPSDVLQCKELYYLLGQIHARQGFLDKETAIVLTDESLLLPVLHSIPPEVENLNITMGYPITSTTPYILLEKLLVLHSGARVNTDETEYDYRDLKAVLTHPYIVERGGNLVAELRKIIEKEQVTIISISFIRSFVHDFTDSHPSAAALIDNIFRPIDSADQMQAYLTDIFSNLGAIHSDSTESRERKEFIYIILEQIQQLAATIRQCELGDLPRGVFGSLLRQTLASRRVAYQGEPLCGLQVMGILETRNLDFENVIILSLTDDNFPGNHPSDSYIPYNLRQAFGLPTPTDHEAMWGYYFYRLISRCNNLVMMYSSAADDRLTGEQSRYIYQLEYESPHTIQRANVNLEIESLPREKIVIEKSQPIIAVMNRTKLFPSKINRYIDCPLKFYFSDIEKLRAEEEVSEQITHLDVGNTLHLALEALYTPIIGRPSAQKLIAAITPEAIATAVSEAMVAVMGRRAELIASDGRMQMHRDIVIRYVTNIVRWDATRSGDFVIQAIEQEVEYTFEAGTTLGEYTLPQSVTISGIIDRTDLMADGTVRIIDYKSGGNSAKADSIESLFTNTRASTGNYNAHNSALLQIMLYGLVQRLKSRSDVTAALYVARKMGDNMLGEPFNPYPVFKTDGEPYFTDYQAIKFSDKTISELFTQLGTLLADMFDLSQPIAQTPHQEVCGYCDFKTLCRVST